MLSDACATDNRISCVLDNSDDMGDIAVMDIL